MPMTYANNEVLEFYKVLPFNYQETNEDLLNSIKATKVTDLYPVLAPYLKRRNLKIIEVGCGVGWLANGLAFHHQCAVTAIDFNPVAIKRAQTVGKHLENSANVLCSSLTLDDNVWHHIIATFEFGGTGRLYVDGSECDSVDVSGITGSINSTGNLALGYRKDTTPRAAFNGTMDEVRIWNISLSKEQVLALYLNKTFTIVSNETRKLDEWNVSITPNDGKEDGITKFSNTITILNTLPTQGTPVLNTTNLATNKTNTNLTAYNVSSADVDGDRIRNIYNWYVNGTSIMVLNMPFEGINRTNTNNSWDYSGNQDAGKDSGNGSSFGDIGEKR